MSFTPEYETEWDVSLPFHMSGGDYLFILPCGTEIQIVAGTGQINVPLVSLHPIKQHGIEWEPKL